MINKVECNKIFEHFNGHYRVILDFLNAKSLYQIVDLDYKYVWCFDHQEVGVEWRECKNELFGKQREFSTIFMRNMVTEFIIETNNFLMIVPEINQTIKIIQTNVLPPYYLNLNNIKGKARYDLLKERIDYLFELEIPGAADYGVITSPNYAFLEKIIQKLNI